MRPERPPTQPTTRSSAWCRPISDPQDLTVVTSDSALAERVHSAGASTQPAASFRDLIDPVG